MQPYSIILPDLEQNGIIFNSPHSGTYLPDDILEQIAIDPNLLLYSGDILVDKLISGTPRYGATVFINHYSRIYVDTNRSANEIDSEMFKNLDNGTSFNRSDKVDRGFGVISRKSFNGKEIYYSKLPASDIDYRLNQVYYPVHSALNDLLFKLHQLRGNYILFDCHSMPSYEFINAGASYRKQPDLIIGNRFHNSCSKKLTLYVKEYFAQHNLTVAYNNPYPGGYNTQHYSNVGDNRQALQLEFKRSLYMDENTLEPNEGFASLQQLLTDFSKNISNNFDLLVPRK